MSDGYVDKPRPLNEAVSSRLLIVIIAVMVAVFVGDLLVPLGIAGGVLYVVAVLLALWFLPHYVFGFAAACTVLTVVGYFASWEGGDIFVDFANRAVAVLAIWVVAVLGLHRRKLSETVHRHGQIIDQVQDAVITVDMSGVIDYWNKGAESVFGYSAHDIVGQSARKLYASGDAEVIRQDVLDRLIAEGSAELETEGLRQNGEVIVIRQWVLLRRDESYEPAGVIFQVSDVTRRREVEKAATRMEAFYQNVLDELPLQVAIFDTEGRFLYLNPASLSIPERRAWIIGRTEREYFEYVGRNVELADERDSYRRKAMAERTKVTYEELFETQSGERRSYAHGFFPVVDADGEIDKVLGFRYDITDHKRTAWALQESLARLKAIVDTAADGILTIDGDGIVESCNQAAQRLFGFEPAEAIGRHIDTLIAGMNGEAAGGLYEGLPTRIVSTSTSEMAEFVALKKDGTTFPVEVATSKLRLDDQPLFTAIVRDLTNRKRAERALLRYNERLEAFRQMDQAILTASSTKAVAQVAVDHLARLIPAGMVCIALFDSSEDIASVLTVQCEGLSSRESTASIREFLGASEESEVQECISRACVQGHVTMVPDVSADGRDLASVVAIPLTVQDSVIGMLKLEARSGARFGSEDIDIAKEVAGV
ncbi:MAG TPA: PAS domain S-box protein, partial [Rhodothermia bacterium]|nr:PAS domain S-box protein [Rhodothermia bacterium]